MGWSQYLLNFDSKVKECFGCNRCIKRVFSGQPPPREPNVNCAINPPLIHQHHHPIQPLHFVSTAADDGQTIQIALKPVVVFGERLCIPLQMKKGN